MMIVWFVVGCAAGVALGWLMASSRAQRAQGAAGAQIAAKEAEVAGLRAGLLERDRLMEEKTREADSLRAAGDMARLEVARVQSRLDAEAKAADE